MSCLNLAIKLQHFRQTRNERRAVFNRTNPNFDSWLQMFSCVSLLSNISLDALIVPWMRRFTSHNLQKLFTAISTPVFRSMVLFSPHNCYLFEATEPAHSTRHNQTLCDWLTGTPMILNFRQAPPTIRSGPVQNGTLHVHLRSYGLRMAAVALRHESAEDREGLGCHLGRAYALAVSRTCNGRRVSVKSTRLWSVPFPI